MSMVAEDLVGVRALLILRGRAVGSFCDDDGRLCLRQAMIEVSNAPSTTLGDGGTHIGMRPRVEEAAARDSAMHRELVRHLPQGLQELPGRLVYHPQGLDVLACFNDEPATCDEDVLDLIDKALADLGAL
ncbi:DUF6197 family protein [Mycolicibacterium vanbaalenii]|uniref:Uncharacterized protein n=1 Tax=Mycolicibacterium vanbaalenii (strain DSM 7251 / JCM 13017 / BCRC 16820 / KCTC 9966 / NRRL B-24157 / PYR-1) TaxID=350058 RepID=A1THS4_MYCVP|nr:hypothetical protein [Mycolicibacterium vanbaalenii]ABM16724.1 hypothetical protein Mvan_5966 [Mycolicibacterium vanbaalenii PYR-1]MCV7128347.1 hypothetical protein [Mycolicibacterium vanbaalenii PYR-1]